jgi:hypothetical protein
MLSSFGNRGSSVLSIRRAPFPEHTFGIETKPQLQRPGCIESNGSWVGPSQYRHYF